MNAQQFARFWKAKEDTATAHPGKLVKVNAGLYLLYNGQMHTIEHITPAKGFAHDEWAISTGNDLHHSQHNSLKECLESLKLALDS